MDHHEKSGSGWSVQCLVFSVHCPLSTVPQPRLSWVLVGCVILRECQIDLYLPSQVYERAALSNFCSSITRISWSLQLCQMYNVIKTNMANTAATMSTNNGKSNSKDALLAFAFAFAFAFPSDSSMGKRYQTRWDPLIAKMVLKFCATLMARTVTIMSTSTEYYHRMHSMA
jgi:hypothetical protein